MKNKTLTNDAIVVSSTYVTEQNMPILIVTHEDDEEGGSLWQFHCGNGDYDMEKMQLVRLDTILFIDSSIKNVLNLEKGMTATRTSKFSEWNYTRISS